MGPLPSIAISDPLSSAGSFLLSGDKIPINLFFIQSLGALRQALEPITSSCTTPLKLGELVVDFSKLPLPPAAVCQ